MLALILQGLSLFAPHIRLSTAQAALAALGDLPGAASSGTILCLNNSDEDFSGKAPVHHHDSGSCPMCQIVGAGLAGAPEAGPFVTPLPALSGAPAVFERDSAPRAPPRRAASPRWPPILA